MAVAHAGWPVAAFGGAAWSRIIIASRWALVKNRLPRPTSRTSDFPPRTTGMILACDASRRAWPGADGFAGVEVGGLEPTHERLEGHDHDRGGVDAAGVGDPVGGVALDELAERAAHPLRTRTAGDARSFGRGLVLGCGEPEQDLGQHRGLRGREGEPAVGLAVAVVGHREPADLGRVALLLLQELRLVRVSGVGGDDLEEPPAQQLEGAGVVVGGLGDEVRLGLRDQVRAEVVGQLVDRTQDHPRLVHQHLAGSEGVAGDRVGLEVVTQPNDSVGRRVGSAWSGAPASTPCSWHRRPRRPAGRRHAPRRGPSARRPGPRDESARPTSYGSRQRPWTTPTRPPRSQQPSASARSPTPPGGVVWSSLSWFNPSTDHRQSGPENPSFSTGVWELLSSILRGWFRDRRRAPSSTTGTPVHHRSVQIAGG